MRQQVSFEYQLFDSEETLDASLLELLFSARAATALAYAPYSRFRVGAAILMKGGEIVKGGNQENASFPVGICAERVALSTVSSLFPAGSISTIAIAYQYPEGSGDQELILSPCGICRQSILETADRQQSDIRVLLSSPSGKVILLENARHLLPMAFSSGNL